MLRQKISLGQKLFPDYTNQDFESKLSNDCKILSGQIAGCVLWLYYIILIIRLTGFAYITGSLLTILLRIL